MRGVASFTRLAKGTALGAPFIPCLARLAPDGSQMGHAVWQIFVIDILVVKVINLNSVVQLDSYEPFCLIALITSQVFGAVAG